MICDHHTVQYIPTLNYFMGEFYTMLSLKDVTGQFALWQLQVEAKIAECFIILKYVI